LLSHYDCWIIYFYIKMSTLISYNYSLICKIKKNGL
jgi:hypothetical protein